MSEEMIFETKDEKRYAPSLHSPRITPEVDEILRQELKTIPDKLAFKIGEVADLAGVKTYVLRYWETEFDALKPQKSKHNQRVYLKRDVEMVLMIKKLLYRDRFSIEGARSALSRLKKEKKKVTAMEEVVQTVSDLRDRTHDLMMGIQRLRKMLE